MVYYNPEMPKRVYVDESPVGVALTLAQQNMIVNRSGEKEKVWWLVDYTSRTKTKAEEGYRKVGESLELLYEILENKMYLYGTRFTIVGDQKPLVALYSSHSLSLPMWVARHKSKVASFDFDVVYEPRARNPARKRGERDSRW